MGRLPPGVVALRACDRLEEAMAAYLVALAEGASSVHDALAAILLAFEGLQHAHNELEHHQTIVDLLQSQRNDHLRRIHSSRDHIHQLVAYRSALLTLRNHSLAHLHSSPTSSQPYSHALLKNDIFDIAHQIASTASAPPAGCELSRSTRPPYPLESDMRCSLLFKMNVSDDARDVDASAHDHVELVKAPGGNEDGEGGEKNRHSHVTETFGFGSLLDLDL